MSSELPGECHDVVFQIRAQGLREYCYGRFECQYPVVDGSKMVKCTQERPKGDHVCAELEDRET
jgi:hypothetical protein